MQRRDFLYTSLLASGTAFLPACATPEASASAVAEPGGRAYLTLADELLTEWCAALLTYQIDKPEDPSVHGALGCTACGKIHGRCFEMVYPLMYRFSKTGDRSYLTAAERLMVWAENLTMPDGSWTVIPDPKSWRGTTVFGLIGVGEALKHYGALLPEATRMSWTKRLRAAADYVRTTFDLTFTNINYGFSAIYALHLAGELLEEATYTARSKELAEDIPNWFTEPHYLLFGEAKPSDKRSARGLPGIDLGYNVEETLGALVQYAHAVQDPELTALLLKSLDGHAAFMLPDGGWDGGWATRMYKWTYWGSVTTEGCQAAYSLFAAQRPDLVAVAHRSTELMRACTTPEGLLGGGLHFEQAGLEPCIHPTFAHARNLAIVLTTNVKLTNVDTRVPLPREQADGVDFYAELNVWLLARGPWRATVSANDFRYVDRAYQATGGSLSMLHHARVGPVCVASMTEYERIEENNQLPQPGPEFALTPRLELTHDGGTYSNIYDLGAEVRTEDTNGLIEVETEVALLDADHTAPAGVSSAYGIKYTFSEEIVRIRSRPLTATAVHAARLIIPIVSPGAEPIHRVNVNAIEIIKPDGTVRVTANVPLQLREGSAAREFNMVPGVQAVPMFAVPGQGFTGAVEVTITVS